MKGGSYMAIITISRQFGSLGTEIAKQLKEEMEFNYLDKESLEEELIKKYGIPEEDVERYDEKKPAFWDVFYSDKDKYLHFMKTAVYKFAQKGNCIIIGRGGQFLFKNIPGVLNISVVAPLALRLERIKKRYSYNDRLAEQIIRHSDHDRAGFHKFFFHIDWENPELYDLTINTKSFTVKAAVQLIKDALESTGVMEKQSEKENKLADICLSQEVITRIAYIEKIPVQFLEAIAVSGVVTLTGSTITAEDVNYCEVAARKVPGVKEVINEIHYIPTKYGSV
jgi:cytidylate kinase